MKYHPIHDTSYTENFSFHADSVGKFTGFNFPARIQNVIQPNNEYNNNVVCYMEVRRLTSGLSSYDECCQKQRLTHLHANRQGL